jgi:poly(hydroxyalkanoate) depolymerase family esterase
MTSSDPLASAHDTFWSLFALGPMGLAAQFFVDPETAVATQPLKDVVPEVKEAPVVRVEPATGAARWLSRRFEYDDDTLPFKLYIPSGYEGRPLPLIVMLHGAQQDADDFAAGTGMNAVAESEGYIVVYPEQSEGANLFRCWNWFRPGDQTRESGETAMVAALTREVMAMCNVDAARVYVAGMSAGGAMAVNLAVTHPELYAAAAIHSGMAFGVADEPLSALCAMNDGMGKVRLPVAAAGGVRARAVPLIVFHGDADDTVHPRNGEQVVAMSRLLLGDDADAHPPALTHLDSAENGYAYTRHVFRDPENVTVGEQWIVHGLGHAWSGGNPGGTHTDVRGPHATHEIVRFFAQFALDA